MSRGPIRSMAKEAQDELRAAILKRLRHDELTSAQLAQRLRVSRSTVHSVIGKLARAGLVEIAGKDGNAILWRAR